ncbi:MAG: hypothetical protein ACUVQI_05485 [Thermochromatium sp.]
MDVELIEIQEFLASHPPFDQLPEETLACLPRRLSVRYFRCGTPFPPEAIDSTLSLHPAPWRGRATQSSW